MKNNRCSLIVAAVSNLSTAYNLANMSLALVLLSANGLTPTPGETGGLSSVVFAGAICGQLTMGYIGDLVGRARALQLTMLLSIMGAGLSAIPTGSHDDIFLQIILFRFVMGVGAGGVYPLAATAAAEASHGSKAVSLVFSTQGLGQCLVPIVCLACWHWVARADASSSGGDFDWRVLLGAGAIPGLILVPFKLSEQSLSSKLETQEPIDVETLETALINDGFVATREPFVTAPVSPWSIVWKNRAELLPKLIGTGGTWFLFDVTFYANALFAPAVIAALFSSGNGSGGDDTMTPSPAPSVYNVELPHNNGVDDAILHTLLTYSIGLPGYFLAIFYIDRMGCKNIQLMGFTVLAALYCLLALQWGKMGTTETVIIYGLTFLFSNFGPNTSTFILPSETVRRNPKLSLWKSSAC
jgi:PHS family inorganic phosphate transporter-like MFS transporter